MIKVSQSDRRIFQDAIALGNFKRNVFPREIFIRTGRHFIILYSEFAIFWNLSGGGIPERIFLN